MLERQVKLSCCVTWGNSATSLGLLPQQGTVCRYAEGFLAPSPLNTPTVEPPGLPVYSGPLSGLGGDSLGLLCSHFLPLPLQCLRPRRSLRGP